VRVESVRISNFRSLRDAEVALDDLTVIIGANSSGKTSVLEAIRMFGDKHVRLTKADFFAGSGTMEIEMTIDAGKAHNIPKEYLVGGKIMLQKIAELGEDGGIVELLRIKKMCIADLVGVRSMRLARDRQAAMKKLLDRYPGLPHRGAWPDNLNAYEHGRMDDPACRYESRFIDLDQSEFRSKKLVDIMYVPVAMDMEADASDSRGSLLDDLINMTVRRNGAHDARLKEIADEANKKARRLMRSVNREGSSLAGKVGSRALPYADCLEFRLEFSITDLQNSRPRATLTLVEDGLPIPMDRAGSGAQRVSLMALLETIYSLGGGEAGPGGGGTKARIMVIDGPELYQHPQRQGRILRALGGLAGGSAVQVACSTHSPYFVWLEEIGRVRRLQKLGRETAVCQTAMGRIADSVNRTGIRTEQVGEVRMAALLDMVSSRWIAEGLFARLVVLVEGPGDRSMLLATARAMEISLDELEVAIVPCEGKDNIPHVFHVFRHLGVPVYPVWDVDPHIQGRARAKHNRRLNLGLQALADPGATNGRVPLKPRFGPRYSCLVPSLSEATIKMVEEPGMLLTERMGCHGLDTRSKEKKRARKKAIHNQRIMYEVLKVIRGDKRGFEALPTVKIIRRVVRMCGRLQGQARARRREAYDVAAKPLPRTAAAPRGSQADAQAAV